MNSSNNSLWNKPFSHLYIEEQVLTHPRTLALKNQFPEAVTVIIKHYKDVFNRSNQNRMLQSSQKKLIIASNQGQLIFPGAPVCQSFGSDHFYYTSNVMNCIYDCEYCYLQGMYPSSNLVVFVNIEDTFKELETLLSKHPVYLCISYDTDLLALDPLLHFMKDWIFFANQHKNLTLEVRTKSASIPLLTLLPPSEQMIYAWTLSPSQVISKYEHRTPDFTKRLKAIQSAISLKHPVRLCFDPILSYPGAETDYANMLTQVFSLIPPEEIKDVSIGVFRISKEYLKQMRKSRPDSEIVQYPYTNTNGYYHYADRSSTNLFLKFYTQLKQYVPENKIFTWGDDFIQQ